MKHFLAEINLDVPQIKERLQTARGWRDKLSIYALLATRALVIVMFAVLLVGGFTFFFGEDNAPVGVVVLLSLLTFQKVHLGYDIRHASVVLLGIYAIFAFAPLLVQGLGPVPAFFVNAAALFLILLFGCDKVEYYNHAILVLSYLLLYGNPPVDAHSAVLRVVALGLGGIWSASLMYRHHRAYRVGRGFKEVITSFNPLTSAGVWKIQLALTVPFGMLLGTWMGLERPMWIGIATMSVLTPFTRTRRQKARQRIVGTVIGSVLFFALLLVIPANYTLYMGLLAGFCLGFSVSYTYQSIFNAFGALGIAMALFGAQTSVVARIEDNILGVVLALVVVGICDFAIAKLAKYWRTTHSADVGEVSAQ